VAEEIDARVRVALDLPGAMKSDDAEGGDDGDD
jgi:hypothetical protein